MDIIITAFNSNIIKSNNFLIKLIYTIEKQFNRELTNAEEDTIINLIKNINPSRFTNITIKKAIHLLAKISIDELKSKSCNEHNPIDIHEILKQNLGSDIVQDTSDITNPKKDTELILDVSIDSIFGLNDINTLVKKIREPSSSINSAYFLLDSRYRVLENDGTTYFKWIHMNSLTMTQGTINSIGNIRDIVSIKIMPHNIPAVPSAINIYKRITINIEEIPIQSFIAHESRQFHGIGSTAFNTGSPEWIEVDTNKYFNNEFKFNKPITHLDTLTVTYGSPIEPITFDKDRLRGLIVPSNPTNIIFIEPHNIINTTELVYISGFMASNEHYNITIVDSINKQNGIIATVINPTSISIPIDTSSLYFALTGFINTPIVNLTGSLIINTYSQSINGLGTLFEIDLNPNDWIRIYDSELSIYQVDYIVSNTEMYLKTQYKLQSGTFLYAITSNIISGVGTLFITELQVNDRITVVPDIVIGIVKSIINDTTLELTTIYNNNIINNAITFKNNIITDYVDVFFSSKRVFIPIVLTYLASDVHI